MFVCINCMLKYADITNKYCEFCNIIKNTEKQDIYKIIICKSDLEQIDIIKKTYEYFMKNDKIPSPSDIDNNAIIINVNPYLFTKNIYNNDYKIFFTNCINKNKIKIKKIMTKYNNEKLDINKYCKGIDLDKIDLKTYNDYINRLQI